MKNATDEVAFFVEEYPHNNVYIYACKQAKPMQLRFLLLSLCLSAIAHAQQPTGSKKAWDKLKPGMSDIQVKELLGEPSKLENFATVKNNTFDTSVYWRYHNGQVVVITNHLFDRVEKNREELLRSIQLSTSKKNGLTIVPNGKE